MFVSLLKVDGYLKRIYIYKTKVHKTLTTAKPMTSFNKYYNSISKLNSIKIFNFRNLNEKYLFIVTLNVSTYAQLSNLPNLDNNILY